MSLNIVKTTLAPPATGTVSGWTEAMQELVDSSLNSGEIMWNPVPI